MLPLKIALGSLLYLVIGGVIYKLIERQNPFLGLSDADVIVMLIWPLVAILALGSLITDLCFTIADKIVGLFKENR